MKVSISVPNRLFEAAERLGRRRGVSLNELCEAALRRYPKEHRGEVETERLDAVYGGEPGRMDPLIARLQARSLPDDAW